MSTNERKWTPGPWGVEERADGRVVLTADDARDVIASFDTTAPGAGPAIADIWAAEQRANAHLAAAAPEMYEALADQRDHPPACMVRPDHAAPRVQLRGRIHCDCANCERMKVVLAALAKADGRDSGGQS